MESTALADSGLNRVEQVMNYLIRRHEALTANVANVSTPGYKTVDVRFEDVLESEVSELKLVQTSPNHFRVVGPEPELILTEVANLAEGADGNNVNLDRELLAMSLNRLRFQMGVQWASGRLATMKAAIREGGSV